MKSFQNSCNTAANEDQLEQFMLYMKKKVCWENLGNFYLLDIGKNVSALPP